MAQYGVRNDLIQSHKQADTTRNYLVRIVEASTPALLQVEINTKLLDGPALLGPRVEVHLLDIQYWQYGAGANLKHVAALSLYFMGLHETTTFSP